MSVLEVDPSQAVESGAVAEGAVSVDQPADNTL